MMSATRGPMQKRSAEISAVGDYLLQWPAYGVSNEMAERESLKRTKLDGGMQL
jgi:hypothetical protein